MRRSGFRTSNAPVQLGLIILIALSKPGLNQAQPQPISELLEQFNTTKVFWQQFEVARKIVERGIAAFLCNSTPGWGRGIDT